MNQSWSPDRVITKHEAKILIEEQFSELRPAQVASFSEGFDNTGFVVNNQYIFRFPRREIAAELIQTENQILPVLSRILPIPVPNPVFLGGPQGSYPWSFSGYTILQGQNPINVTVEQRMLSVERLAHFLKTLHEFPVSAAEELNIPTDLLERTNIKKRKPMLESRLNQALEEKLIKKNVYNKVQEFLSTIHTSITDSIKALVHGDLHIQNILVDEKGTISAIIDWGDTHIGHPAIDLSIVYSFLPPEGRKRFFNIYGEVDIDTQKTAKFKAIYTTILLILYAHEKKKKELVNECRQTLHLALEE